MNVTIDKRTASIAAAALDELSRRLLLRGDPEVADKMKAVSEALRDADTITIRPPAQG